MIEQIDTGREGTLEFHFTGKVTGGDYDSILVPAVEKALEDVDQIRVLVQIGPNFEGYSLEAAWDDARLGLRHWRGFERVALVSDVDWIKTMVRAMGFAMPCPVKSFDLDQHGDAQYWLGTPLGEIDVHEEDGGVVRVQLEGKLDSSAYQGINEKMDEIIAKNGRIKLLLDMREFDGWHGLGGLSEHFSLVRDHRHAPTRVAIIGNQEWQKMAMRVFSQFVDADVQFFDGSATAEAESWISQG